jgi:hypothetical protein
VILGKTLFADSFDRTSSDDLNASTDGKSGTLGALTWEERISGSEANPDLRIINDSQLKMTNDYSYTTAYFNHNFITDDTFEVSVDVVAASSAGNVRNIGFSVGNSLADVSGWTSNTPIGVPSFPSDFFIGYDPNGTLGTDAGLHIAWWNGTSKQEAYYNTSLSGTTTMSVIFDAPDFNSGSTVNYTASFGAFSHSGTFTWSGTSENYINLFSNLSATGTLDNFEIKTVPEPSALALMGLAFISSGLLRRPRHG